MLKLEFKATYKGANRSILVKDTEYLVLLLSSGKSTKVEATVQDGVFMYPSKKKFLADWVPEEGWESKKANIFKMPARKEKLRPSTITNAEAGSIIYTELMAAINRFNKMSENVYKDRPAELPLYNVRLEQQVYNEETRAKTGLYGAGVLVMDLSIAGNSRKVFQEGISFKTKKELDNVNAYAPNLYMAFLNTLVESSLIYCQSLNPDDPLVEKEIENGKKEQSTNL